MIPAFVRATKRVLSRVGEDALLRGVPCGKVNIEHGVQFDGYDGDRAASRGDVTLQRDVATILNEFSPRIGDVLEHPDGSYRLDGLLEDNGTSRRYVVVAI